MTTFIRACSAALAAFALLVPAAVSAGQQAEAGADPASAASQQTMTPGWSVTPALLFSRTFDDNVLLHGPGDPQESDTINVINPRGEVAYNGRRGQLSMRYDGAFLLYSQLNTLNSYEQHGGISATRKLSKRQTFFLTGSVAAAPTTELLEFTGVPFVRVGSFTDDVRAGLENQLSKRSTLSVDVHVEQARFDASQTFANLLLGGNSIGGDVAFRYRVSGRTTLTADADMQHATIGTAEETFDIQHAVAGVEQQLTEGVRVYAAGGMSRLGVTSFGPPRTGASWKMGLVDHYRSTIIDVSFDRSFVPSFGFGGTMQNEEVSARVHLPITRRIYTQDLISWRREDPLAITVPELRSVWVEAAVGYAARPWIRIEAYYSGTRQTVGLPDKLLEHNQFGIQVIASKPVRIR